MIQRQEYKSSQIGSGWTL